MRRKLTTLLAKQGHNRDGHPRQLIDECLYREHAAHVSGLTTQKVYDSAYSGWSHASRPRDYAISLRSPNIIPQREIVG
jgi:hypothetical protein